VIELGCAHTPFCQETDGKTFDFSDGGLFCEPGSGLPPRGGSAEVASLLFQAGRRKDVGNSVDSNRLSDCITSLFCEHMSTAKEGPPKGPVGMCDFSEERIEEIRIQILNSPEASPGLPYHEVAATKKDICTDLVLWRSVVDIARNRLVLMETSDVRKIWLMSTLDKNQLQDTVRVFVKNEIHPAAKLINQRYRLIASVSLVDQIVEIFLYGHLNKWTMKTWHTSPFKAGMGAADADHAIVSSEIRAMREPASIDSSAHDFNVPGQIQLAYPAFCYLFDRNDWVFTLRVKLELLRGDPILFTGGPRPGAPGRLWGLRRFGITLSGRAETSKINTFEQCVMMKLALWPRLENRVFAMGDDGCLDTHGCSRAEIGKVFEKMGVLLKGVIPQTKSFAMGGGIDFCSHRYDVHSNNFRRMNIGKSLANLLSQTEDRRNWDQFFFEARHCTELNQLVMFACSLGVKLNDATRQIVRQRMIDRAWDAALADVEAQDKSLDSRRQAGKLKVVVNPPYPRRYFTRHFMGGLSSRDLVPRGMRSVVFQEKATRYALMPGLFEEDRHKWKRVPFWTALLILFLFVGTTLGSSCSMVGLRNFESNPTTQYADGMAPTGDKPKRDKQDIAAAARKGVKRINKAVARDAAAGHITAKKGGKSRPKQPRANNDFLSAIVDPEFAGKGKGIPDDETMPSVKFQTSYVDDIKVNAAGDYLAFHTPALSNGGYHPCLMYKGGFAAGNNPLITGLCPTATTTTAGFPVVMSGADTFTPEVVHDVLPAAQKAAVQQNFAAVRPVSMVVKFTPTQAALTASGSLRAGIMSRQQSPASIDWNDFAANLSGTPTINGVAILGSPASPAGLVGGVVMPVTPTLDDLAAGTSFAANVTQPVTLVWRFEDAQDFIYRTTSDEIFDASIAGNPWYSTYNNEACGTYPAVMNTNGALNGVWACPGGITYADEATVVNTIMIQQPYNQWVYPTAFWMVRGATVAGGNQSLGEVRVVINWEGIPITGTSNVMATTPSPSNPMEAAQATNVVPMLPAAYAPDEPSAPETQVFKAVAKSTGDLYAGGDVKSAVEGKSVLAKLGSGLAKAASTFLPFPASLLGTAGEALIDALL